MISTYTVVLQADQRIAVFSGNQDIVLGTGNDDATVEQLLPKQTLGKNYALLPIPGQSKYGYKIVSAADNNVIRETTATSLATLANKGVYPTNFLVR